VPVGGDEPGVDEAIERLVREGRGLLEEALGLPALVLEETVGEIHGPDPRLAGLAEAARRVEVDRVRSRDPELARLVGVPARRLAVGAGEGARERLDRVVARLEARLGDGRAAPEPPRGALEQEAAPERRRCLADAGADQAVEVERAQHRPRRQRPAVEAIVEGLEHRVDDVAQAIRAGGFAQAASPSGDASTTV
jgi:hypothetical protein